MISRQIERANFDVPVRLTLLENDVDKAELKHDEDLKSVGEDMKSFRDELKGIRGILMAILMTLCTGSVLFALNIIVGTIHR